MANKRVLVVEDDITTLRMEERFLQSEGYDVDCVQSAAEALEILERTEYAVVVSDIMMPDMDGFELAKTIRDRYQKKLKVILVSAMERVMGQEKRYAAAVLKKPFTQKSLALSVNMITGGPGPVDDSTPQAAAPQASAQAAAPQASTQAAAPAQPSAEASPAPTPEVSPAPQATEELVHQVPADQPIVPGFEQPQLTLASGPPNQPIPLDKPLEPNFEQASTGGAPQPSPQVQQQQPNKPPPPPPPKAAPAKPPPPPQPPAASPLQGQPVAPVKPKRPIRP